VSIASALTFPLPVTMTDWYPLWHRATSVAVSGQFPTTH
jgi:hypothetical protein